MPFIPVPGVVQAELVYMQAGSFVENVLHYQHPGIINTEDMVDFAIAFVGTWTSSMKSFIPASVSLVNVKVSDLTTNVSPVINFSAGMPINGLRAGSLLPSNVSLCITKRTNLRGRSNRGRLYWPGLVEADVTENTVSSAVVAGIVDACESMKVVTVNAVNWELVVVSRFSEHNPRQAGVFTPVVNFTCDGIIDSQRRRLPGRGQ